MILSLILERECSVCEVIQAMQISQTRASRNLRILCDTGLLKVRQEGVWVLYSANEEALQGCYAGLGEIIRNSLQDDEIVVRDQERLKRAVRQSPCAKHIARCGD